MKSFSNAMLLGLMREKKISQAKMAKAIGISEAAFWNKVNGVSDFTRTEMFLICRELGSNDPYSIFFITNDGKTHR